MPERFPPPIDYPVIGQPFIVSSDAKARYTLLAVRQGNDGIIELETLREGPSGISFSERRLNPTTNQFIYIRDADTAEQFNAQERKERGGWADFVEGSISNLVCRHVMRLVLN
jgi:hypothetical protein